jgi:purine nucleoside phosphorylase
MKMQNCPHFSEEKKIDARVCSYCMKTIGIEHKVKTSSVGNWVIVFVIVLVWFIWSMNKG